MSALGINLSCAVTPLELTFNFVLPPVISDNESFAPKLTFVSVSPSCIISCGITKAPAIDISSGLEIRKGLKDPKLIRDFVIKCKSL